MHTIIIGFSAGLIFGFGLLASGMADPTKVYAFLDVTGHWDPTLLFVMLGAVTTTSIGYYLLLQRHKPRFAAVFYLPTNPVIDRPLIMGAILFGIGWGLSGLCPGPALVNVSSGDTDLILFIAAMVLGMKIFAWQQRITTSP